MKKPTATFQITNIFTLLLFVVLFFNNTTSLFSQSSREQFSGVLLYDSPENNLYIWTENLEKNRINLRIGNKQGEIFEERNIPGISAKKMDVYSYLHPKNKQLYFLFHPNWESGADRNVSMSYELFIINIETKKIKKTLFINNTKVFVVHRSDIYPDKELLFIEAALDNSVNYIDLVNDSLHNIPDAKRISFCFNEYAILRKNVVKKDETAWAYVLFDINTKKVFDKELDYNEFQGGKAIDFNGRMLIQLTDDKEKIYYKEVNIEKQKLSKEKVDNPVSNPTHFPIKPFTTSTKDFDLVKYNFNAFLKAASVDEKLKFADLMAGQIKAKYKNEIEINYITQTLTDLISKHPNDARIQKWLEWIYKQNALSYTSQINLMQLAVDKGVLDDKLFSVVFKYYNEKTSELALNSRALREAVFNFAKKGFETITFSDYTDRLVTKYEIALLEVYLTKNSDYDEYLKMNEQAKKQDTTAVTSFLTNYEGKIPKILIGKLYYELAESLRKSNATTQDSLTIAKILFHFESAQQNDFDSDEFYVGYMRSLLFLKHDFAKSDSVLSEFMKKYGNLPQAKTWFTNYPFNAGVEAFKIGNYDFAASFLSTYLKNDNNYQKEANLRLFQAAMYTMNWEEAAKAAFYLEKEIGIKELEAYFPDYERWKSCLETQNPTLLPQKTNILLIEENQRLYTEAKKGLSSGNSSYLKTMEKQALFFDSIGIKRYAQEAWVQIGSYHFEKTNYKEAERTYMLCMNSQPVDFECPKNYIIVLVQQGLINPAQEIADSLFALYPNDPNVRKACGQVYNFYASESTQYGTDAETIELFEKSLSFDENEVTCLFLAYYYSKTGKYSKKDEMVRRAKAINPNVFYDYPDFKTLLGM